MNLFQVRTFNGKKWQVIRSYAFEQEALDFAQGLLIEWDIKKISLQEANEKAVA